MQFEFSNINTQYNNANADIIASITKENADAAKSNISSVYDSKNMNLDAAVLSISEKGTARINAMLSKSIQLRANSVDPELSTSDRIEIRKELNEIRKEIEEIRNEDEPVLNKEDADKMLEESTSNIIKNAKDSIKTQNSNRESVLQLL